jgi:hypothetical protein
VELTVPQLDGLERLGRKLQFFMGFDDILAKIGSLKDMSIHVQQLRFQIGIHFV